MGWVETFVNTYLLWTVESCVHCFHEEDHEQHGKNMDSELVYVFASRDDAEAFMREHGEHYITSHKEWLFLVERWQTGDNGDPHWRALTDACVEAHKTGMAALPPKEWPYTWWYRADGSPLDQGSGENLRSLDAEAAFSKAGILIGGAV